VSALATTGPVVREVLEGHVRVERGAPELAEAPRVAVLAHWSRRPQLSRSASTLVQQLQLHGYRVVVVSGCESPKPLAFGEDVDVDGLVVLRKPNVGYDFGSWTVGLQLCPGAEAAERTLLVNDSMAGPFADLGPLLEAFDRAPVDVWGLTDTQQFGSHLQSYFLGFREGVLAERPLRRFWADIRHHTDKQQIIFDNEIGLSHLLRLEGYVQAPNFPHERVVPPGQNPVIKGWRRLLDLGLPFLKREILRAPEVAPAGHTAPSVLAHRFGVDVRAWVDDEVAAG
jgi:lipopolysaccharide biosynthesis protein